LPTCKEFLNGLGDYLDHAADPSTRELVERHIRECPNCHVVHDTTKNTIRVYRGEQAQEIAPQVASGLLDAVQRRAAMRRKPCDQ